MKCDKLCKIKLLEHRVSYIGYKFARRHPQKGVIGQLRRQHKMPYTDDGIFPDLIINSHAFPSRITVGQIIESLFGKMCAKLGGNLIVEPFSSPDPGYIIFKRTHVHSYEESR